MFFSNDGIAKYLNENFECAWEMVRPVPVINIDFGNGIKLTRTLNGNIATYFCTSDGKVYDILPGIVSSEEFMIRSELAKLMHDQLKGTFSKSTLVSTYHRVLKGLVTASEKEILDAGNKTVRMMDMSKRKVEQRLKDGLHSVFAARAKATRTESENESLGKDTEYNRKNRYPKVHALLSRRPLATPKQITKIVYKDILHTDLDDPYLGLAPYVLGGEVGRHHD